MEKVKKAKRAKGAKGTAEEKSQPIVYPRPGFKKIVWLFLAASLIGTVLETVFCFIVHGEFQVRQGLIYGPFSQVYGIGAVVMSYAVLPMARFGMPAVFGVAALTGGLVEFSCSYGQEMIWGTRSWDFSDQVFSIGGRTSLLFMLFWGILGCVFVKWIYPLLSGWVDKVKISKSGAVCAVITVFFLFNFTISGLAVGRWMERSTGVVAQDELDSYLDEQYPNQLMEYIYAEMKVVEPAGPTSADK